MAYQVTLKPSNICFSVEENEPILAAAKRQNLNLPHACQNGVCGACKAHVVQGSVEQAEHDELALTPQEESEGNILTCCAIAKSDLEIDLPGFDVATPVVKTFPARVETVEKIHNVAIIRLSLPKGQEFVFNPGQYLDILLKDNQHRSYSMANSPLEKGIIELHIRSQKGGLFSEHVFDAMKEQEILRIKAPLGSFTLQYHKPKPLLFIASGTGFAPIKSILETMVANKDSRSVHFYWGARNKNELYMQQMAEAFAQKLPNYQFIPVLSEPLAEDQWQGRVGLVHEAVLADFDDLSLYEVYACGAPVMVEAAATSFIEQKKLAKDAFYSDAFTPSAVK
ncbi:CDP-6-deoxy-delta-3,4-glucoseen reductase [Neisseria sp. Ec49-e6-T10]|uniref:CDP-6-deoxy-delta-3,4-glucoseen reductase n=1 Tax=Neisseria sp. Ec49-e6-T10 TaxID=3140744 RepID=UPI003EBB3AAD